MALSNKQKVFIEEYLQCWNATEAARRAGYAFPNVEGPKNLVKPSIKALIQVRIDEKAMSADEVLARLADQARGTMADFITLRDDGYFIVDLKKAEAAGKLHLIKKIRQVRTVKNEEYEEIRTDVEIYDSHAALVDLGRHHKLFTDNVEHTGEIAIKGYAIVSPDDWDDTETD